MQVQKRNGELENINIDKLHKVVMYACEDITGVSASQVEIHSQIQFYDKIKSEQLQETLIKSAADLISEETPNSAIKKFIINKQIQTSNRVLKLTDDYGIISE